MRRFIKKVSNILLSDNKKYEHIHLDNYFSCNLLFCLCKIWELVILAQSSKNPDFVYQQLLKDDAWIVDDVISNVDKDKLDGPFLLYVPSIGKTIKFYGKVGKYEDSQKRIGNEL